MKTWRKHFTTPITWWSVSILTSLFSMSLVSKIRHVSFTHSLLSWDSNYYRDIISQGYERHLPMNNGKILPNRDAFFPIFPFLVRCMDSLAPGNVVVAYLIVNLIASAGAVVVFYYIARELLPPEKARYATALFGIYPATFIYLWMYPEAISVFIIAVAIALLVKKHPYWASAVFGIASATRPNAVFMGLAPAIFIAMEFAKNNTFTRSKQYLRQAFVACIQILCSGTLAAFGFIAFLFYISSITGISGAWYRIQREGWNESTRPFYSLASYAHRVFTFDLSIRVLIVVASTLIYALSMYALYKYCKDNNYSSISIALSVPTSIVILLALSNYSTASSLRFGIIAIPIFIAVASTLSARTMKYVVPASVALLFLFCFFYTWAHNAPFLMGSP